MSTFNIAMICLGAYALGMATAFWLDPYRQARKIALDGWQNARDGWANTLRDLAGVTRHEIYNEMADHLDDFPVNRPAPKYTGFNPGLAAAPKHHMEGSESEIAERIARGTW